MKLTTKFDIGDSVLTPISPAKGTVREIAITRTWDGYTSSSSLFIIYHVEIYLMEPERAGYRCVKLEFKEDELRNAS